MDAEHTPGPWKSRSSVDGDFLGIYPDTGRPEFPIAKMPDYLKKEVIEANARLIAAAPALLRALWNLSQRVAEQGFDTSEADRAIAKATKP